MTTPDPPDRSATARAGLAGDVNGFFGLVVDNVSILAFIATVLIGVYGLPADVVYGRMFPGTALGVLVGNALYAAMPVRSRGAKVAAT